MVPAAETYFSGQQLALAQLVDKADAHAVLAFAKSLSLAELNAYGKEQNSVLVYAALKASADAKFYPVVTALIQAGADPLLREDESDASVMQAAVGNAYQSRDLQLLRATLDAGINPDTDAYVGRNSPLIMSVSGQGGLGAIRLLVEYGADVKRRDLGGRTALSRSISTLGLDEVNFLLDNGADPKVVDLYGVSFAHMLNEAIKDLENDLRLPKALAIRDRIVAMGVPWPPLPPEQLREDYKRRFKEKTGKDYIFMPDPGYQAFMPKYEPAPVRKVPMQR